MTKRRSVFLRLFAFGACLALVIVLAPQMGPGLAYALEEPEKKNVAADKPAKVSSRIKAIAKTCFECHGEGGVSATPTRPSIGGQKSAYIVKQLKAFRRAAIKGKAEPRPVTPAAKVKPADAAGNKDSNDKKVKKPRAGRSDPVMDHFFATLSNDDLGSTALYVSSLSCKARGAADKKSADVPPMPVPDIARRCAACHGNKGVSSHAHVPNLAGQQRGYLRRELLLLRESAWGNNADHTEGWRTHPIMEKQVARLRIDAVDTLAYYYAQLDCRG